MKNKNQSQSIRDKTKVAPYSASLSQNGASDTQNHAESDVKVSMATAHASGSAPSGDDEILKEVLKETIMKYNGGHTRSNVIRTFKGAIKKAIQLTKQADDKKFDDWKKRLKDKQKIKLKELNKNLKNCTPHSSLWWTHANRHAEVECFMEEIDKLSGFNNDDEREERDEK